MTSGGEMTQREWHQKARSNLMKIWSLEYQQGMTCGVSCIHVFTCVCRLDLIIRFADCADQMC